MESASAKENIHLSQYVPCHSVPRLLRRDFRRRKEKFKPEMDTEPASKRRKLAPQQTEPLLPSSQPAQSSFADVLARLKEEAQETQGMSRVASEQFAH